MARWAATVGRDVVACVAVEVRDPLVAIRVGARFGRDADKSLCRL